jgi:hypothetical protein
MRRILFCAAFVAACALNARAQGSGDYPKVELYGGYSHARVESNAGTNTFSFGGPATTVEPCAPEGEPFFHTDFRRFFCERRGFDGFDASVTFNLSRHVGLKADVTGHYKSETFVDGDETNAVRERLHQFLFGVQFKENSRGARLKPFAHALAGAARYSDRNHETAPGLDFVVRDTLTSFALKLGGGLDLRAGRRVDVRLFELDYNPVFARRRETDITGAPLSITLGGRTAHNFNVGAGLVFH